MTALDLTDLKRRLAVHTNSARRIQAEPMFSIRADAVWELIAAAKERDELRAKLKLSSDIETRLRAALATSKDPCVYCQLPAEEMSMCRTGVHGCGRADDLVGCPEIGASLENDQLRARIRELKAALKPFADAASVYDPDKGNDPSAAWFHDFTIGSLRRARAALDSKPGDNGETAQ